jgi:hypothetical protein
VRALAVGFLATVVGLSLASRAAAEKAANAASKPDDTELTVVPVVGGDSDVGIGGGYVASLALTRAGVQPYVWRVESAGALTARFGDHPIRLGYLNDYLLFVVPHAFLERLHAEAKLSYTVEPGLTYHGIGNASAPDPGRERSDPYFMFERANLSTRLALRYRLGSHFRLLWGLSVSHSELTPAEHGRLAEDMASGDPVIRRLVHVEEKHGVVEFSYGFGWDSRDNEVSTRSGQLHTLRFDLAPGGTDLVPYRWARANLALRGYVTLLPKRLVFAARGVVDSLFGDPPFYELTRFDDTQAIGGGRGVRGVPAGRYHGRLKLFTNLELRSELFDFFLFEKRNVFGLTAFFDGGRVFSELPRSRLLDGSGLGLKFGAGLGARLAAGKSFVLRGDVAWSPDASPVGAYLLAGQLF